MKPEVRSPKSETSSLAFIALGSNLGDSIQIVRRAMTRLQTFSDAPLLRSSLWQSSPVDCPPGSPPFVNAVVGFVPRAGETPESLLKKLQSVEEEFGRTRKRVLNEPRSLDLDLITFGSAVRENEDLTLPHPRAHLRRFVLQPLSQIAAEFVFPGRRLSVRQLLDTLESKERLTLLR